MIPNKKIEDVIRFFHAYHRWFNPRSRLLLVGAHSGFERYVAMLQNLIDRLGASDVHFLGHVSNQELTAYYELADVFLCASEHEGFCVPLVESFHMGVPVLAFGATAIPATMDGAGILYHHKDPVRVAALIDQVVTDRHVADAVVDSQDRALERLRQKDFAGTLLRFVDRLEQGPRRPHPPVAADFWEQVHESESLDELRPFRPGAFQALPKGPSAPGL
jgi:glycosyltransferase involved in cell wall biosynthesis